MYCLSDKQIDFILNDISARGVEMESLQQDLLDHVCCIIEQNLEENGNFEHFYQNTIQTFYKKELWEIEEETLFLLIYKNYYTMKKIMLVSGVFSAFFITFGILFKFLHWPGAGMGLVLGIGTCSLIFLPLLFVLKTKEKQSTRDKLIIGLGSLAGISLSLGILFKIMHWPLANFLGLSSVLIMFFVFLPIYFFTGIRNPETKVNTIVSSMLLIIGCGLFLALARSPRSSLMNDVKNTYDFVRFQQILDEEKGMLVTLQKKDTHETPLQVASRHLDKLCEELKSELVEMETGVKKLDFTFEDEQRFIEDHNFGRDPFGASSESLSKYNVLVTLLSDYRILTVNKPELKQIPTNSMFIEYFKTGNPNMVTTFSLLNQLTQIQMYVLQNERKLLSLN